jgi:putative phosphoribosyl transferase
VTEVRFADRSEAGRLLAAALAGRHLAAPMVLALPRGGVPVAYEVAHSLGAPLDVLLVRKIGAPGNPEYGIGAVVEGDPPKTILNEALVRMTGATPAYVADEERRQLGEMERRRLAYRGGGAPPSVEGRTVILVDDGIATGASLRAALAALAERHPARLVLAVPVAPPEALAELAPLVDDVVCLSQPEHFQAVGLHYRNFDQTSDAEVVTLLDRAKGRPPS